MVNRLKISYFKFFKTYYLSSVVCLYVCMYVNKIKITNLIHLDGVSFLRIYQKVLVVCDSVNFRFLAMFFMLFFLFFFLMEVMIPVVGGRGIWKYGGNKIGKKRRQGVLG